MQVNGYVLFFKTVLNRTENYITLTQIHNKIRLKVGGTVLKIDIL